MTCCRDNAYQATSSRLTVNRIAFACLVAVLCAATALGGTRYTELADPPRDEGIRPAPHIDLRRVQVVDLAEAVRVDVTVTDLTAAPAEDWLSYIVWFELPSRDAGGIQASRQDGEWSFVGVLGDDVRFAPEGAIDAPSSRISFTLDARFDGLSLTSAGAGAGVPGRSVTTPGLDSHWCGLLCPETVYVPSADEFLPARYDCVWAEGVC